MEELLDPIILNNKSVAIKFDNNSQLIEFIELCNSKGKHFQKNIFGNVYKQTIDIIKKDYLNSINEPIGIFALHHYYDEHAFYIRDWGEYDDYNDWDSYHFINYSTLLRRNENINDLLNK
jgi:hypothetical protein